jgi:hypothetical protein
MQINFMWLTGKIIQLSVHPTSTIGDVKLNIQDKEGLPPNQFVLTWCGKILRDDTTLVDNSITNHSTLRIMFTLRGC